MPQHDMIIANGSGAAVRADINDALAALGSTMKGPNAPPAPIAGMMWLDDDTPSASVWTLKIYDGADWISIATFDISANTWAPSISLLRLAAGTAAAPAISFGDTDTGIFGPAAGQLAVATNGVQRALFDENGNMVIGGSSALQRFNAINSGIGGGAPASSGSAADPNAVARFGVGAVVLDVGATLAGAMWLQARAAGNYATNFPLSLNPNGGGVNMVGPVNVTSGGQTVTGDLEASGNLRFNSGFGSAGLAFGVRGWASVTVAAGAPTMDANGNFTSITDNGAGDFTFNFTSNMPDTHYAVAGSAVGQTNTAGVQLGLAVNTANGQPLLKSTSQVRIGLYRADANSYVDAATFSIMIVR